MSRYTDSPVLTVLEKEVNRQTDEGKTVRLKPKDLRGMIIGNKNIINTFSNINTILLICITADKLLLELKTKTLKHTKLLPQSLFHSSLKSGLKTCCHFYKVKLGTLYLYLALALHCHF